MAGNSRRTVIVLHGICTALVWSAAAANSQESTSGASAAAVEEAARAREEYQRFCEHYEKKPPAGLKFVITAIEGDDQPRVDPLFHGMTFFGCQVAENGALSLFYLHDRGHKGSSGSSIPAADLMRLDDLLATLPDDGARLPPAGRRVVIQVAGRERTLVRVFDRGNAPDEVLEVLRLSRARIRPWLPEFRPESEIEARPYQHGGFLSVFPDGKRILFTCANGPLQFWEPITHETLGENRRVSQRDAIAYNADATLAALTGYGECEVVDTKNWHRIHLYEEPYVDRRQPALTAPRFTPDGKYLVAHCSEPSLRIFETATWKRVPRLPDVPEDTVRYFPAPKRKLAVVQAKSGSIALWNCARNEAVSELDKDCTAAEVAFAPDESQFALITFKKWNEVRLRLWSAETGKFVRELRAYEQNTVEKVQGAFWSPDGQYLLAATKSDSFFTSENISVWNVKSGRHRGEFTGSSGTVGAAILPDCSQLVSGSADGKIRFWDFPSAIERIRGFESSLPVR